MVFAHTQVSSVVTGLVIDVITSNYCHGCELEHKSSFAEWSAANKSDCQKNVTSSSEAMEREGAITMWSQSIYLHKFQYTELLSDSDSKSYKALIDRNLSISKIECTNHVAKRMRTTLCKLVATQRSNEQPISGKGKLTDKRIKDLTRYYGAAIKSHDNLEDMEKAVWATFFHIFSTVLHNFCPTDSTAWYYSQQAQASPIISSRANHFLLNSHL